jgi:hypothetical protein
MSDIVRCNYIYTKSKDMRQCCSMTRNIEEGLCGMHNAKHRASLKKTQIVQEAKRKEQRRIAKEKRLQEKEDFINKINSVSHKIEAA